MMRNKIAMAAVVAGLALLPARAAAQEFSGQLKIGIHKVKLDQGKLYQITMTSSDPIKPFVHTNDGRLTVVFAQNPADDKIFFMPAMSKEHTFYVYPPTFGSPKSDTSDYKVTFKAWDIDAKAVHDVKNKLTDQDPLYKDRNTHFKAYKLQAKAGQIYIIDLVKDGVLDPYLLLEDAKGIIINSDDDGGGNLNARIIFSAPKDGEYNIIATTLSKETGGFHLTVRVAK